MGIASKSWTLKITLGVFLNVFFFLNVGPISTTEIGYTCSCYMAALYLATFYCRHNIQKWTDIDII